MRRGDRTDPETVGQRIKQARLQLAARRGETVTQAWLAVQCQVAGPTVSQWEKGIVSPTLAMIPRIAKALEVTAGWLAFGEVPDAEPLLNPATDRKLTDEEIERARAQVAAARASRTAGAQKKRNSR